MSTATRQIIRLEALPSWSENLFQLPYNDLPQQDPSPASGKPPQVDIREDINAKLYLVLADISFLTSLDVDAIVIPTDELLSGTANQLTRALLSAAGTAEIARACEDLGR